MNRFTLILIAVLAASCSGGSKTPTAPTPVAANPQPAPAPSLSLAGAWTGTLTHPRGAVRINSWTATQSGANVSGAMVMDVGEGTLVNATLTGTVSGSQLTSVIFTVAAGAIQGLPTCSISGAGTQAATAASLSGSLAMTFTPACVGPDLPSATATGTWQLSLAK